MVLGSSMNDFPEGDNTMHPSRGQDGRKDLALQA